MTLELLDSYSSESLPWLASSSVTTEPIKPGLNGLPGPWKKRAGHQAIIQAWDFRPGGNFVLDMQRVAAETDKTLVVLSENYLKAEFTQPKWAAASDKVLNLLNRSHPFPQSQFSLHLILPRCCQKLI